MNYMGKNDELETKDWRDGLDREGHLEVARMEDGMARMNLTLEQVKLDRDRYRDKRTTAKRVLAAVAVVALTLIIAGAYLIITTDETDQPVFECDHAPKFTGTNQSLNLGAAECEFESDSLATLMLGYALLAPGVLMTTVTAFVLLRKVGN